MTGWTGIDAITEWVRYRPVTFFLTMFTCCVIESWLGL